MRSRKKLLIPLAVGALAAVGGAGVFMAFTSSDSATQNVSTGTVHIAITNDANSGHITDAFTNRAAGDTITRTFTVTNTSSLALKTLTLTVTAPQSDLLISDAQGLHVAVWTCDSAYTTNTCGGTETVRSADAKESAIDSTPIDINTANTVDSSSNSVHDNAQDVYVKVKVSLPYAAGNNLQDQSTTLTYTVNALQRDGVDV